MFPSIRGDQYVSSFSEPLPNSARFFQDSFSDSFEVTGGVLNVIPRCQGFFQDSWRYPRYWPLKAIGYLRSEILEDAPAPLGILCGR